MIEDKTKEQQPASPVKPKRGQRLRSLWAQLQCMGLLHRHRLRRKTQNHVNDFGRKLAQNSAVPVIGETLYALGYSTEYGFVRVGRGLRSGWLWLWQAFTTLLANAAAMAAPATASVGQARPPCSPCSEAGRSCPSRGPGCAGAFLGKHVIVLFLRDNSWPTNRCAVPATAASLEGQRPGHRRHQRRRHATNRAMTDQNGRDIRAARRIPRVGCLASLPGPAGEPTAQGCAALSTSPCSAGSHRGGSSAGSATLRPSRCRSISCIAPSALFV